jgi:hypothetical protein
MGPKLNISDQVTAGYHGTSLAAADEIVRTNFKLSAPDSGAYLGEGVYFFDNQPSQAKRWATTRFGTTPGTKVAVIQSKIKYGRLLNLTDREHHDSIQWFAREFQRKANKTVTLPTIIDIVAEKLNAEVVKAMRIPRKPSFLMETGFSADIEVILAVRDVTNILSREQIWSQMTTS